MPGSSSNKSDLLFDGAKFAAGAELRRRRLLLQREGASSGAPPVTTTSSMATTPLVVAAQQPQQQQQQAPVSTTSIRRSSTTQLSVRHPAERPASPWLGFSAADWGSATHIHQRFCEMAEDDRVGVRSPSSTPSTPTRTPPQQLPVLRTYSWDDFNCGGTSTTSRLFGTHDANNLKVDAFVFEAHSASSSTSDLLLLPPPSTSIMQRPSNIDLNAGAVALRTGSVLIDMFDEGAYGRHRADGDRVDDGNPSGNVAYAVIDSLLNDG